ncbi:MAG: undecaprenyl-phosphate glucose phosphotransferase [Planctomycetota bacterium]|jgi:Undecaprenyl-phosphate glucose phosphotransferase
MVKKHSQGLNILLFLVDALATGGAWLLAFLLRQEGGEILPVKRGEPEFYLYLQVLPIVIAAGALSYRFVGLYRPGGSKGTVPEFIGALKGTLLALVLLTAASFFQRGYEFSRWIVAFFAVTNTISLTGARLLFWRIAAVLRARGVGVSRALVAGSGRLGGRVVESVRRNPWAGIEIIGFLDDRKERQGRTLQGIPVLGPLDEMASVIREKLVDLVFLALPGTDHDRAAQVIESLSEEMVDVRIVPDLTSFYTLNADFSAFDGLPVHSLRESPLYGWNRVVKRFVDILFSGTFLLVFSPIYFFLALGVKLSSPGPVFYKQERMGLDGKVFPMLKFRSMRVDAEKETGAVWAREHDPRRTRFGTFLRKTSLDEIPQFINVFLGHMSVVGPRPERPVFIDQFKSSIPRYMLRHKMKAGITGWAQVNGWRGNTSLRKRIQYDLYYIEHWSLWLDIRIMFLTLLRGLVAPHAY